MFKKFSLQRNEQGFSLPELMVGLALIVIVAAIAVPSFINQRKTNVDSETRNALEEVVSRIESHLIREPGATIAITKKPGGLIEIRVGTVIENYNVTSPTLDIRANATAGGNGAYRLGAWDTKGKKYVSAPSALLFESVNMEFSVGAFTP